jgi:hypothetical protein
MPETPPGAHLATVPMQSLVKIIATMDRLSVEQRSAVIQALAERYLEHGGRAQVCGWCQTSYATAAEASACARACRERATTGTSTIAPW